MNKSEKISAKITTHGESRNDSKGRKATKEYRSWTRMRERCFRKNHNRYHLYGGRGISIDPEWNDFKKFLSDMGRAPSPKHSLDRIDNNKNYGPGNCRWATNVQQSLNKTDTLFGTVKGIRKPVLEWCRIFGLSEARVINRIKLGKSMERALLDTACTPYAKKKPNRQLTIDELIAELGLQHILKEAEAELAQLMAGIEGEK